MQRRCRPVVLLALLWAAGGALADTAYVTDTVTVAVFPGADLKGEPVERLLSGSLVDVLQSKDGVAEVKTGAGNTGWMRTGFLTTNLPAVIKLENAESELSKVNARLDAANEKIAALEQAQAGLKQAAAAAKKDMGWMRVELDKARDKAAALEKQLASQRSETSEVDEQASGLEEELAALRSEKQDLQQRLAAALMIDEEVGEQAPAAAAHERPFPWSVLTLVLGLVVGFAAGFYWIDRRVRRRFGGVRVY